MNKPEKPCDLLITAGLILTLDDNSRILKDSALAVAGRTVEGYFSIFMKGMKGVYRHCDERHLHRYLAEFDFRYSNRAARGVDDNERTREALRGISGKRLIYNQTH
jgi:ISXO2-like transposase domain